MIYFLQASAGGAIKIGTTKCLSQRLGCLRSETGEELRVLAVMDGGRPEEKSLHRRFAHLRIGKYALCEWFDPAGDLLDFITSDGRPWDGTDEVPRRPNSGTLIRVSDEFAEAMRTASSFVRLSVAGYADAYLTPVIAERMEHLDR